MLGTVLPCSRGRTTADRWLVVGLVAVAIAGCSDRTSGEAWCEQAAAFVDAFHEGETAEPDSAEAQEAFDRAVEEAEALRALDAPSDVAEPLEIVLTGLPPLASEEQEQRFSAASDEIVDYLVTTCDLPLEQVEWLRSDMRD